jgi:nicotinate-nucleotide--dimethylbenzimidazole phosphoribosyltransferase
MSVDGWNTLLVLGGIRSGKSEFAESLVSGATSVRYLATSAPVSLSESPDDPEWDARISAHRDRRPETWETDEVGADPGLLIATLLEAKPDETLLVDDLGGWVGVLLDPAHQPADDVKTIEELAAAVRACAARLVLVSPEVGLTLVPTTPLGRAFTDALGTVNQAVAAATDAVVLVVAGQPAWLKGATVAVSPGVAPTLPAETVLPDVPAPVALPDVSAQPHVSAQPDVSAASEVIELPEVITPVAAPVSSPSASSPGDALRGPTHALPIVRSGLVIQPNMELPLPDDETGPAAIERLTTLDIGGSGLGELTGVVRFAAATQGTDTPRPWQSVRVLLVQGDHAGGASAGASAGEPARRAAQARLGLGALAQLTASAGATLQVVDAPASAPIEHGPALTLEEVDHALRLGWRLAEEAVDGGADLLVIAASGAGTPAAAAAVLAATAGAEPAAVLPAVRTPEGGYDDNAWMERCAAVRDAMQRVRKGGREAKDILAQVGGGDIAVVTGILLGATARRTPVLLDGPVGVAAALVSRDLAGQARHWCLLPDHNGDPAVKLAADVLGLTPILNMRLDLGEGTAALAALPLLRSAIALAGSLPLRNLPASADAAADASSEGDAAALSAAALSATADGAVAGTTADAAAVDSAEGATTGSAGTGTAVAGSTAAATAGATGTTADVSTTTAGVEAADSADDATSVISGPASSPDDTTGVVTESSDSDDATTVISGPTGTGDDAPTVITEAGGATDDATTVITRAAGSAGDTTAVIPQVRTSDAAGNSGAEGSGAAGTTSGAGTGSGTRDAATSVADDPEQTTVISVPAASDDSPTTAFRVPPKDDPEATTVISTGTPATFAQPTGEDDEHGNSWIPGFGNPRRSDDPGTPAKH